MKDFGAFEMIYSGQALEKAGRAVSDPDWLQKLFGKDEELLEKKRQTLFRVYGVFKERYSGLVNTSRVSIISVPNRVELLGKHTDYQGGETFLLTGPRTFFAVSAPATDGLSELYNAEEWYGSTALRLRRGNPEVLTRGEGSNYTVSVAKRLCKNLLDAGLGPLQDVKSVFMGDIPFGGGTSGSSAKLITDFFIYASANGLLESDDFVSLVLENGKRAGVLPVVAQPGVKADRFLFALSMYLAHFENGLDFGDLRGDRGVGTFGGSEDHTAIMLGKRGTLLRCCFCPTRILQRVQMPRDLEVIVAYSGRVAEKTKEAKALYNRLSINARSCVDRLNRINGIRSELLRDFYPTLEFEQKARKAYRQLENIDGELAGRAHQFFRENALIGRTVELLKSGGYVTAGSLINESHELSKRYLGNIVDEVDWLQKKANDIGAYGATGFGAGFGGSCYALVKREKSAEFISMWRASYQKRFPQYINVARFERYPASSGAFWETIHG